MLSMHVIKRASRGKEGKDTEHLPEQNWTCSSSALPEIFVHDYFCHLIPSKLSHSVKCLLSDLLERSATLHPKDLPTIQCTLKLERSGKGTCFLTSSFCSVAHRDLMHQSLDVHSSK